MLIREVRPVVVAVAAAVTVWGVEPVKGFRLFRARVVFPCLLYTSPSPRDRTRSRMPSSA